MERSAAAGSAPRALVITPNAVDGELALGFLAERGIPAEARQAIAELGGELPPEAGCIVLAEEALADADLPVLRQVLEAQPAWSDLPLVLVAGAGARLGALLQQAFPEAGNVTLLERPLNPLTLVSAVQVGLRARSRQLEVRDLLGRLEQALKQRDDFLAMLAHELRNPLAPMRNAIYLLKSLQTGEPLIAKARDMLERQVNHMARIVDDLLDVARLERGKIELKPERLDLNGAVRAAAEDCEPAIRGRAHRSTLQLAGEPLIVYADPVRLDQLLTNLILNAAKFTPGGGEIELRTRREGDIALVSVRDTGIGIRPEMLEAVFAPFAQDDHTLARSAGGLGIGLSIARAIAQLHGGSLHARSKGLNKGAVFEARLPLSRAPAVQASEKPAAAAPRPRKVLVVEDNADIRESLRLVLGLWGHQVVMAETGNEGLALALEEKPDVALIDIGLPGMSGYDVASQIRERAGALGIRLVAMTGYGQPADRQRAAAAGFDHHLLKPVDAEVLNELVSR